MFSKQSILLLLILEVLQLSRSPVHCQDGGLIISPPEGVVAPLGVDVTFTCNTTSMVFWIIENIQITVSIVQSAFNMSKIYSPLPTLNYIELLVHANINNNGTRVRCGAQVDVTDAPEESEEVLLLIYGEPSPPFNLTLTLPPSGLGVMLSWERGDALAGERVMFVITSLNNASLRTYESFTNETSISLAPPPDPMGRTCPLYEFTVQSENDFNRSRSGVSQKTLIPTVPYTLDSNDITMVTMRTGPSTTLTFDAPSPCAEFGVEEYVLMFVEVTNTLSVFNTSHTANEGRVSLTIRSSDGLQLGRIYNITMVAINSAGSSLSFFMLSTAELQSASLIFDLPSSSAILTCHFTSDATALGCHASLGTQFNINATRDNGFDIAMATIPLELSVLTELSMLPVTVAELYSDGSISSFTIPADVTTLPSTTTPLATSSIPHETTTSSMGESTTTSSSSSSSSSSFTGVSTMAGSSILQGDSLYIIIGGIAGVILILLLVIVTVVCIIKRSRSSSKNLRSVALNSEELNVNNVYGKTETFPYLNGVTEVNGVTLDNGQQARCNTYDNPNLEGANGGAALNTYDTPDQGAKGSAVPMYETVQSAKKAMLAAGGPAVLNPVYGPTGAPASSPPPLTSSPPPCKAAPNPVYSETNLNSHQIVDLSALNPVYADIGKRKPRLQTDPHYASATGQGTGGGGTSASHTGDTVAYDVPPPMHDQLPNLCIRRADSAGYPPPTPMYEELKVTKRLNSVGGANNEDEDGVNLIRNESYGLIGMSCDLTSSTQPLFNN